MVRNGFHCLFSDDIVLSVQRCTATLKGLGKRLRNFLKNQMVMGYMRPVSCFNKGKQSEFKERVWFTEQSCSCPHNYEQEAA